MKQAILFLPFYMIGHLLMSQTGFESGYVLTNQGDTLQGEVRYNWVTKPNELTFKTIDGDNLTYHPSNLQRFKIENGDLYVSLKVKLDISPTNHEELLKIGEDLFEERSLFVKALILGSANLYQSYDQERSRYHYFIENEKSNGPLELLGGKRAVSNTDVPTSSNDTRAFKNQDKYKGQLAYLLGDCQEIVSSIQSMTSLTQNSITSITEKYNRCGDNISSYRRSKSLKRSRLRIGILAGVQSLDVDFASYPERTASLVNNLGLKFLLDINDRKNLNLALTAFHRNYKFSKENTQESIWRLTPSSSITRTTTTRSIPNYSWQQLTFILEAQYSIGIGSNKFFVNTGPGISFAYNSNVTLTTITSTISSPSNEITEGLSVRDLTTDDRDRQFLLNFGTGYQWKRFLGSIDYELGGAMIKLGTERSHAISFRLTYLIL